MNLDEVATLPNGLRVVVAPLPAAAPRARGALGPRRLSLRDARRQRDQPLPRAHDLPGDPASPQRPRREPGVRAARRLALRVDAGRPRHLLALACRRSRSTRRARCSARCCCSPRSATSTSSAASSSRRSSRTWTTRAARSTPDNLSRALIYGDHPLGFTITGGESHVRSFDEAALRRMARRGTTRPTTPSSPSPGAVDVAPAMRLAERDFGRLPRGDAHDVRGRHGTRRRRRRLRDRRERLEPDRPPRVPARVRREPTRCGRRSTCSCASSTTGCRRGSTTASATRAVSATTCRPPTTATRTTASSTWPRGAAQARRARDARDPGDVRRACARGPDGRGAGEGSPAHRVGRARDGRFGRGDGGVLRRRASSSIASQTPEEHVAELARVDGSAGPRGGAGAGTAGAAERGRRGAARGRRGRAAGGGREGLDGSGLR